MIEYRKGDLFDFFDDYRQKEEVIPRFILHSCNCKGVWGSGFAVQAKMKFKSAFQHYKLFCEREKEENLVGNYKISITSVRMINLFTSRGYGKFVDLPEKILENTEKALNLMFDELDEKHGYRSVEIHSPKINSGLFKVPWEKTEAIILDQFEKHKDRNLSWIVWELDL